MTCHKLLAHVRGVQSGDVVYLVYHHTTYIMPCECDWEDHVDMRCVNGSFSIIYCKFKFKFKICLLSTTAFRYNTFYTIMWPMPHIHIHSIWYSSIMRLQFIDIAMLWSIPGLVWALDPLHSGGSLRQHRGSVLAGSIWHHRNKQQVTRVRYKIINDTRTNQNMGDCIHWMNRRVFRRHKHRTCVKWYKIW